jgi:hypothetical protein
MLFEPGAPRVGHSFVVPAELKPGLLGELLVQIAIPNVEVLRGFDARTDDLQPVLGGNEIDLDLPRFPHRPLRRRKSVGATPHEEPELLSPPDHLDGDSARRISEFHRPIDIEANQKRQVLLSFNGLVER